jgi:hypothetical protein
MLASSPKAGVPENAVSQNNNHRAEDAIGKYVLTHQQAGNLTWLIMTI